MYAVILTESGFARMQETVSKAYERAVTLDDSALLLRLKMALDELEALRCRAIDIADRLDALEKLTGGERVVFIRPKD